MPKPRRATGGSIFVELFVRAKSSPPEAWGARRANRNLRRSRQKETQLWTPASQRASSFGVLNFCVSGAGNVSQFRLCFKEDNCARHARGRRRGAGGKRRPQGTKKLRRRRQEGGQGGVGPPLLLEGYFHPIFHPPQKPLPPHQGFKLLSGLLPGRFHPVFQKAVALQGFLPGGSPLPKKAHSVAKR